MDLVLLPGQHIHIVGIGGFGMSAIARILLESGYTISGSDQHPSALAQALAQDGAQVFVGHAGENISGAEVVLYSSAVQSDNPELQAARAAKVPVYNRREFLPALLEGQQTIAIAGTHGKTTTTALLIHVMREAGLDPSYIVGGVMKNTGRNAGAGKGEYFVIEADEYDNMFLGLSPSIALLNNVEWDHPDFFPEPADLLRAFAQYVGRLAPDGVLVANMDDDVVQAIAGARRERLLPVQFYGIENNSADWWAIDLEAVHGGMRFVVCQGAGTQGVIGPAQLSIPGRHNVQNALGALAIARHLGIPFPEIARAFQSFAGTGRRSEVMGEAGGVRVINDYAHHPTAIRVTLKTWRDQPGLRHLWAVWQPHTYSRIRALGESFLESFSAADHVLITDIYAAREAPQPDINAKGLARAMKHADARYSGDLFETAQLLATEVQPGDVVVLLSAGDAPRIGQALLDVLNKR
ncbi:MAG: UDP-N-acetylmuramate--L-alanine ligase [Anaerolineae bacterium]|nr:UDP-N-acetylmuramate--L-alanine ligase [Anaerolineae bacterium]